MFSDGLKSGNLTRRAVLKNSKCMMLARELLQPALRMQHVLLELTKPASVETVARQILVRAVAERNQCARR